MNFKKSSDKKNNFAWKLLYLIWFLRLIRPERLIADYVPALSPLKSIPSILLLLLVIIWITSDIKKYKYNIFVVFLVAMLLSTIFAVNHTRALWAFRTVFEMYLLAGVTFSYANDMKKVNKLFALYFGYIVYFALWGIVGLGRVEWDNILNEEDAYGPLMTMGVAFGYYYLRVFNKGISRIIVMLGTVLCIGGVVASFARGAFVILIAVIGVIFVRERNKIRNFFFAVTAGIIVIISANIIFPNNAFWNEMKTIAEGTSEGTGADRKILWKVAWYEFIDHPVIGVGPYNFGVLAPSYVVKMPNRERYIDPGTIWGRSLHNGYFQILCELGIIGSIILIMMLFDFRKDNKAIKNNDFNQNNPGLHDVVRYKQIAYGIELTTFAVLLNIFFYDMIFYTWLWELLILNKLLYIRLSENTIEEAVQSKKYKRY